MHECSVHVATAVLGLLPLYSLIHWSFKRFCLMRSYFTSQKMKTQGLEDRHYLRFPFGRFSPDPE